MKPDAQVESWRMTADALANVQVGSWRMKTDAHANFPTFALSNFRTFQLSAPQAQLSILAPQIK